jgi:hypothetical protein
VSESRLHFPPETSDRVEVDRVLAIPSNDIQPIYIRHSGDTLAVNNSDWPPLYTLKSDLTREELFHRLRNHDLFTSDVLISPIITGGHITAVIADK